jgi:hypothetical protein
MDFKKDLQICIAGRESRESATLVVGKTNEKYQFSSWDIIKLDNFRKELPFEIPLLHKELI